ncbi:hypothetical protein Cni_G01080 [Canna indica]|uniref:Transcription repressor n=1 Tax=Canna indica TaxID=4628 RepID=A0AAQ3JLY0_9LILI|nr:hypothetical protein Cni_G01080 [Canna indica]
MDKRLRLHLPRFLPYFHGFLAKDNGAASHPVSSDVDFHHVPSSPLHGRQHPPFVSAGCCLPSRRRSAAAKRGLVGVHQSPRETPAYLWRKEEKWWHVVPCAAATDVDVKTSLLPSQEHGLRSRSWRDLATAGNSVAGRQRKVGPRRRRRQPRGGIRPSADDDSGWSSSDEASETLMPKMKVELPDSMIRRRRRRMRTRQPPTERSSAVGKLIRSASPAVKGSFAVVKLSEEPRVDFLRSMAEMVVEKRILDSRGLQQLLRCFLSLNSHQHYGAIFAAYEDIWAALFPGVPAATGSFYR